MKILNLKGNDTKNILNVTLKVLKAGGLVIFPSDTVYGLLVDATNRKAVDKLIAFKNRPPGKPISVFVADWKMLEENVTIGKSSEKLLEEFVPGPFTVILDSRRKVCRKLESEKGGLGIRMPRFDLVTKLVKEFGNPVTATSANLSGRPPHYSVKTLLAELPKVKRDLVDLIIDSGKLPRNKPSTIVDLTKPKLTILRKGDIVLNKVKNYRSLSPGQTEKIGGYLIEKYHDKKKPVVFIIEGELGVGKTVLVKGMGRALGIEDIISPTFVIYYQYGNFYHFDLYQIEEGREFDHLGVDEMLRAGNILALEWGEKSGAIYNKLKSKAKIIFIKMSYVNQKEREIIVNEK